MARSRKLPVLVGVLLVALAGALAWWWWRGRAPAESAQALTLYGNVDIRQVSLAFNASDRIATMTAREGARVRSGEVLATLDSTRLEHNLAHAEAQADAQRAQLAALEAGTRPEEIRKARADVAAAEAEADNAAREYARQRDLLKQHLSSQQAVDTALAQQNTTRAQLKAAQETLALAVAGPRQEDIDAARATLQALQAQLALARRQLADATLHAPDAGIIQNRILEPGDMASPQTPVYTLALTDPVWVRAYVEEPDLGRMQPGMSAEVSTDSYPGKQYRAWVGYVSPTAEFTPKSVETTRVRTDLVYQVRVYVCNPHSELRLGMPATVRIPLDQPAPQAGAPAPCAQP